MIQAIEAAMTEKNARKAVVPQSVRTKQTNSAMMTRAIERSDQKKLAVANNFISKRILAFAGRYQQVPVSVDFGFVLTGRQCPASV